MSSTRIKGAQRLNLKDIIRGNLTVAGVDLLTEEGFDEGEAAVGELEGAVRAVAILF